jgi:hypothetical protein
VRPVSEVAKGKFREVNGSTFDAYLKGRTKKAAGATGR